MNRLKKHLFLGTVCINLSLAFSAIATEETRKGSGFQVAWARGFYNFLEKFGQAKLEELGLKDPGEEQRMEQRQELEQKTMEGMRVWKEAYGKVLKEMETRTAKEAEHYYTLALEYHYSQEEIREDCGEEVRALYEKAAVRGHADAQKVLKGLQALERQRAKQELMRAKEAEEEAQEARRVWEQAQAEEMEAKRNEEWKETRRLR
ncbi:MAG: hypothetical protein K0R52_8 [Alphaproteobacteria bacterium]|jgi:hypothetical protein|nr:hypothetical protein [Alphaproteobacteria bacterium]